MSYSKTEKAALARAAIFSTQLLPATNHLQQQFIEIRSFPQEANTYMPPIEGVFFMGPHNFGLVHDRRAFGRQQHG
jgi:hypothetical protein